MQQSFNLEQASMASENLKNTAIAVDAMRDANKALKSQYKKMNIDKIEAVQDEMEDLLEQANEVQETLGRSYALGDEIDEDDLEAELDALGDELDFEEEGEPSYLQETPLNLPSTGIAELPEVCFSVHSLCNSFKLDRPTRNRLNDFTLERTATTSKYIQDNKITQCFPGHTNTVVAQACIFSDRLQDMR